MKSPTCERPSCINTAPSFDKQWAGSILGFVLGGGQPCDGSYMALESLDEGLNFGLLEVVPDVVGNAKNIYWLSFNAEVTAIAASGVTCHDNSIGLRNLFRRSIEAGDNPSVSNSEGIWPLCIPLFINQCFCGRGHTL